MSESGNLPQLPGQSSAIRLISVKSQGCGSRKRSDLIIAAYVNISPESLSEWYDTRHGSDALIGIRNLIYL